MVCAIEFLSAHGVLASNGQSLLRIEVTGTATECPLIRLEINGHGPFPIAVDANGDWSAALQIGSDLPAGEFVCGQTRLDILATCSGGIGDCQQELKIEAMQCVFDAPPQPNCPTVTVSARIDQDCEGSRRSVTFTVSVEGAPAVYELHYGDGTTEPTPSVPYATPHTFPPHHYETDTDQDTSYAFIVRLTGPSYGCPDTPGLVTLGPCPPDRPEPPADCPNTVEALLQRRSLQGQIVLLTPILPLDPSTPYEFPCLAAGDYRLSAGVPVGSADTFSFSVNGEIAESGASSDYDFTLADGDEVTISFAAIVEGCPGPLTRSISLRVCLDCPREVDLAVYRIDDAGGRVPLSEDDLREPCLAEGRYLFEVLSPLGEPYSYAWFVDDMDQAGGSIRQAGESGVEFVFDLADGQTADVTALVDVDAPECGPLPATVRLTGCACPDNLQIRIFDSNGVPVNPILPVPPGQYEAELSGDNLAAAATNWRQDGAFLGNGTRQTFTVAAAPTTTCGCPPAAPATTVSVSALQDGCPTVTASQTLIVQARYGMSLCCEILDMAILVVLGLLAVSVVLWICPQVLVQPAAVAVAGAVAPWAVLASLAILIGLLLLWWLCCQPDTCFDILPMIWRAGFIVGICFLYFGSCLLCPSVIPLIGLVGMAVFIVFLGWWLFECRPSRCLLIYLIGKLTVAFTIVGIVEAAIGLLPLFLGTTICISPIAVIGLVVIEAILASISILWPFSCPGNNPRAA